MEVAVVHHMEVVWGVDLDPMTEATVDLKEGMGGTCQCQACEEVEEEMVAGT